MHYGRTDPACARSRTRNIHLINDRRTAGLSATACQGSLKKPSSKASWKAVVSIVPSDIKCLSSTLPRPAWNIARLFYMSPTSKNSNSTVILNRIMIEASP